MAHQRTSEGLTRYSSLELGELRDVGTSPISSDGIFDVGTLEGITDTVWAESSTFFSEVFSGVYLGERSSSETGLVSIVSLVASSSDDVGTLEVVGGIFSFRPSFKIASFGRSDIGTSVSIGIDSSKGPEIGVELPSFDVTGGGLEILPA
ncbi:hypothetical protein PanWU01x14_159530 [Parasponia andersonii]|uniref:Uncharacterized protein n=1 Tax=Parasponia andersonii TaxID=3476 RepID=A0A2P5CEF1_PARAD|nr:hypothetical protein PanWU01x14_159530 [Parasponia andersonii]